MLKSLVACILNFFYYVNKSFDFFLYAIYTVKTKKKRKFNFLFFQQPYWYTEFIVGIFFLTGSFLFLVCFSVCIFPVFTLFFYLFFLFLLWVCTGCFLLFYRNFVEKRIFLYFFFSHLFFCLEKLFNYRTGKFFCFLCDFVFWYFRAMNVPFSFLLKVKFSYERICFYITCSLCSIISIFTFVPSFTSAGF